MTATDRNLLPLIEGEFSLTEDIQAPFSIQL